jgi:UDPglucose 6-dehydrogenase
MKHLCACLAELGDQVMCMDVDESKIQHLKKGKLTIYQPGLKEIVLRCMNELALLAEKLGAVIEHVRKGIGSDIRIGYYFLYTGCGYFGSCFPNDLKALQQIAIEHGQPLKVLSAVEEANEAQKYVLPARIKARFGADLTGKHFAIWGLAFKPNADDVREATALVFIQELLDAGATMCAYDPVATEHVKIIFDQQNSILYAKNANDAMLNADALIIVTEWKVFQAPDFVKVRQLLKTPVIFDGKNIFTPSAVRAEGFEYYPIGRL